MGLCEACCVQPLPLLPAVIAGHSRPKDGVASLAYDPAIHLLRKMLDPRVKPAGDVARVVRAVAHFHHSSTTEPRISSSAMKNIST